MNSLFVMNSRLRTGSHLHHKESVKPPTEKPLPGCLEESKDKVQGNTATGNEVDNPS